MHTSSTLAIYIHMYIHSKSKHTRMYSVRRSISSLARAWRLTAKRSFHWLHSPCNVNSFLWSVLIERTDESVEIAGSFIGMHTVLRLAPFSQTCTRIANVP